MKKIALIFFLSVITFTHAQTKSKKQAKAPTEWDQLDKAFIAVIKALESADNASFLQLSLREVDCVDCVGATEVTKEGAFVPAGFFYAVISQKFTESPVYKAMVKKGYSFSSITLKDFKPKVMPRDYPKDLKLYEVWVETYRPDELSKGHKGTSHSFRFVKVNGQFKFYGLTSIP
jgi:hypothetical protein